MVGSVGQNMPLAGHKRGSHKGARKATLLQTDQIVEMCMSSHRKSTRTQTILRYQKGLHRLFNLGPVQARDLPAGEFTQSGAREPAFTPRPWCCPSRLGSFAPMRIQLMDSKKSQHGSRQIALLRPGGSRTSWHSNFNMQPGDTNKNVYLVPTWNIQWRGYSSYHVLILALRVGKPKTTWRLVRNVSIQLAKDGLRCKSKRPSTEVHPTTKCHATWNSDT